MITDWSCGKFGGFRTVIDLTDGKGAAFLMMRYG